MSALFGTYARANLAFERGEGVRLFTSDGRDYIDFYAGIGVNALGYGDPHVVNALKAGADNVWHVSNIFQITQAEKLAQRLCDMSFAESVFFTNSGAEALECAIKTARHYQFAEGHPERTEIIAFKGAFHGRTLGTIAAGGNPSYLEGFGEPLAGFVHVAPNDLDAVKNAVSDKTAGILLEPVQGEGGLTVMEDGFLQALRKICDEQSLVLIFDEVQCGFGRTGKMWAHEWSGVEPDIMAVAKAIGAGFPLGACMARKNIAASMVPGTHGSTYGGNPLACTVGNAVMDRFEDPSLMAHVNEIAPKLRWHLQQLAQKFPDLVVEVRGRGMISGLKLTPPVREIVALARDHGVLTVAASDNVMRVMPPLVIQEADLEDGFKRLEATLSAYQATQNAN